MDIAFYDDCTCAGCERRRARELRGPMSAVDLRDVTSQKRPVLDVTSYEPLTRQLVEKRLGELERQNADLQASNNKLLDRTRRAEARVAQLEAQLGDSA